MGTEPLTALQLIDLYAEKLAKQMEPIAWVELYQQGWRNPVQLLQQLAQSALFEDKFQALADEEAKMGAFENLVLCCLQELVINVRDRSKLALEDWQQLQAFFFDAMSHVEAESEALHWFLLQLTGMGLQPAAEFLDASRAWQAQRFESEYDYDIDEVDDLVPALSEMLEDEQVDNEFMVYELLANQMTHLPRGVAEEMLAHFFSFEDSRLSDAAILFLLHPDDYIRHDVLLLLKQKSFQADVSPIGLRRMITIRNWIPEEDRQSLDKIIKQIRVAGLPCAPAEVPSDVKLVKVLTSSIDGAGAQTILTLFKVGRRFRLIGAVFKENYGLLDTWVTPLTTKIECTDVLQRFAEELFTLEVSADYLQYVLPHALTLNVGAHEPLSPNVLYWLELLGFDCWQPQPLNFEQLVREWAADHAVEIEPQAIRASLQRSRQWLQQQAFAIGWFEAGDDTDELLLDLEKQLNVQAPSQPLHNFIADTLMEPHRQKWCERFVVLGLWSQAKRKKRGPNWQDFFCLAWLLKHDRPMHELPLMVEIGCDTFFNAMGDEEGPGDEESKDGDNLVSEEAFDEVSASLEQWLDDEFGKEEEEPAASATEDLVSLLPLFGHDEWHGMDVSDQVAILTQLAAQDLPKQTLTLHALHGFLFALRCAPVSLAESEWLPVVFGGRLGDSLPASVGAELTGLVGRFAQAVAGDVEQQQASIPCLLELGEQGFPYQPLARWCAGCLLAIQTTGGIEAWQRQSEDDDLARDLAWTTATLFAVQATEQVAPEVLPFDLDLLHLVVENLMEWSRVEVNHD